MGKRVKNVAKTVGNVVTGGPAVGAIKAAASGGNIVQGFSKGLLGQEGLFGSTSGILGGGGESGRQNFIDPGSPPAMIDPRSAEFAFDAYQQKYGGTLPPSARAGMDIAQQQASRLVDRGVADAAAASAAAQSTLARKGGLSQGAMERLSRSGAYDALLARQQGAAQGAEMAQNAAMRGLQQSEQTAANLADAYMRLLQQNQQMAGNIYAARTGAQTLANQPQTGGLFGGGGFLGTGLRIFG